MSFNPVTLDPDTGGDPPDSGNDKGDDQQATDDLQEPHQALPPDIRFSPSRHVITAFDQIDGAKASAGQRRSDYPAPV
jgi:hypothetical protein